jgi:putative Mn2+ efflux pump MntP
LSTRSGFGLLGFAPWVPALVFGAAAAVATLIGLHIGRFAGRLIRIRSDLLSGVALVLAATALPIQFG